jgi:hypothetical protein
MHLDMHQKSQKRITVTLPESMVDLAMDLGPLAFGEVSQNAVIRGFFLQGLRAEQDRQKDLHRLKVQERLNDVIQNSSGVWARLMEAQAEMEAEGVDPLGGAAEEDGDIPSWFSAPRPDDEATK